MQSLLSWSKRNRRLLVWAAVLAPVLWWFNYSVIIPICMPYSKPVTMYLEWNEKQRASGSVERITFRIPSAYLIPINSPASRGAGYHSTIGFSFDKQEERPACLLQKQDYPDTKNYQIYVTLQSFGKALVDPAEARECSSRTPVVPSPKSGFDSYKSDMGQCFIPKDRGDTRVFFNCIIADGMRGCRAWTVYKDMRVTYGFHHTHLAEWKEIHAKVLKKIDSFIYDIDS